MNPHESKCTVKSTEPLKKQGAWTIDEVIEPDGRNKLGREVDSYGRKEVF